MRFTSFLAAVSLTMGALIAGTDGQTVGSGVRSTINPAITTPEIVDDFPADPPMTPYAPRPSAAYGVCDPCGKSACGSLLRGWGLGILDEGACAGDPWTLLPEDPCRAWNAGGWIQIGYHTQGVNKDPDSQRPIGDGMFNNYPNVVQLHQAWAWIERPMDLERNCYDWGFRMDYVYGTDGPDTQAFGGRDREWDNDWEHGTFYGHAIPQLYFEVGYGNWRVKAGHFFTIIGYEVVPAPHNFFYSHSFTMYNAEPFTHTGVLAEYSLSENLTFYGGWTAGWDTGFTRNYGDAFLGGISVQLTDHLAVTYATTMGNFGGGQGESDHNGYAHSIVLDWQVTDRLTYVLQSDYVDNDRFLNAGGNEKVWGVNQYLIYRLHDCLAAGIRYEHYEDPRIGDQVNSLTMGLNIRPHRNVVLRPEVRIDDYGPAARVHPLRDTALFGIDAIFTF